jgi:hypothetical protein
MRRCDVRMNMTAVPTIVICVAMLAGLALMCAGCASPPIQPSVRGEAAAQGGTAAADVSEVTTTPATAFAQPGGTANSRAVTAKAERQATNTAAGEAIQGVIFPGGAAYMTMMKADPVIVSLSERINAESEKDEPDGELLTRLYAEFTEHSDRVKGAVEATCPDFSKLTTINVMILVCKDNGAADGETGDQQTESVANAMAKVVGATMGVEMPEDDKDVDGDKADDS